MTSSWPPSINQLLTTVHEGLLHDYLGMNLDFSQEGKVKIDMSGYIKKVLSANNITSSAKSPTSSNFSFDPPEDSPTLSEAAMKSLRFVTDLGILLAS